MPAGSQTIEEIQALTERIAAIVRQGRIDRGLPPESPPDFVELPLSFILVDRVMPFKAIAVKYAAILADGTPVKVDVDSLYETYGLSAQLLSESVGCHCGSMGGSALGILKIMKRINNAIDNGTIAEVDISAQVRTLHLSIKMMDGDVHYDAYDGKSTIGVPEQIRIIDDEKKRLLSDPDAYQEVWDAMMAIYETRREEGEYNYE